MIHVVQVLFIFALKKWLTAQNYSLRLTIIVIRVQNRMVVCFARQQISPKCSAKITGFMDYMKAQSIFWFRCCQLYKRCYWSGFLWDPQLFLKRILARYSNNKVLPEFIANALEDVLLLFTNCSWCLLNASYGFRSNLRNLKFFSSC